MTRDPDLFDELNTPERRELVRVLNSAARPSRRKKPGALPLVTVPGLDPLTGHRLT